MTWKLQAITGEHTGQEISIDRDMLVGRHQSADIVLPQAEISRKHAAFHLREQALWVQDLTSSNGTFVNDVRVENEALLKEGDIVQFASLKFSVLQPAQAAQYAEEQTSAPAPQAEVVVQPSEAVAVSETAQAEAPVESVAQRMNDQGIPELAERHAGMQLSRDGMPQNVSVPKPAPIPEGVDVHAPAACTADLNEVPADCAVQEKETQKNASIGLISLIVIIVLAVIAWLLMK
ncbi:FHA domain-containing protein [Acinetobacter sp. ANC 3813]|uniref:FHA domain-containing protein n=1 Tax=Acinetobacter sp. ANC 3813 TaxID=1977873 RepID=UPI000A344DF5|nr:FHA domain-containing protein [Acinetobacter sp. ANC 3813]OTG86822.1 FHA domain-containing protein [Acinetobacter sp. ANC 3813]